MTRASPSFDGLASIRRPTATTVSAASTKAPGWSPAASRAFSPARRSAARRGVSPFNGVSSMSRGSIASGVTPAWASNSWRRGLALARTSGGRGAETLTGPV